jgi:NADH dehydrogenase FAD-containing subunit
MSAKSRMKVHIIGAGPTGMSLAGKYSGRVIMTLQSMTERLPQVALGGNPKRDQEIFTHIE